MKCIRFGIASIFAIFLGMTTSAQTVIDATTAATTSTTCCTLRFNDEDFSFDSEGRIVSVRIELQWVRSDGAIQNTEAIAITDGDPALTSDDFLTGSGANGSPAGYLRATIEPLEGESGSVPRRWRRRRLRWLKDNAQLSDNTITIQ